MKIVRAILLCCVTASAFGQSNLRTGESVNGFPNWAERVIVEWMNRARADEMTKQGYFDHNSHCAVVSNIDALYPAGCDASASCACTGGLATAWSDRVALSEAGANGRARRTGMTPRRRIRRTPSSTAGARRCCSSAALRRTARGPRA